MVRYPAGPKFGSTTPYLVAPGGGLEDGEEYADAAVREVREETGLIVAVIKPLAVEDLVCSLWRCCKLWFLCEYVSGEVRETDESKVEGITEVGWFTKAELSREVVYPWLLTQFDWDAFASPDWQVQWAGLRQMDF